MEIIRCYTCNSAIGNKYERFRKEINNIKQDQEKKSKQDSGLIRAQRMSPAGSQSNEVQDDNNVNHIIENERYFEKKSYKKIFEKLEINNECCRRHFMTNISINQKEDDTYQMYHEIYPIISKT